RTAPVRDRRRAVHVHERLGHRRHLAGGDTHDEVPEQLGLALAESHELRGDRVLRLVERAHLRLRLEPDLEALEGDVEADRARLPGARVTLEVEHAEAADAPILRRILPAVDLDACRRGHTLVTPRRGAVVAHAHRTHESLPARMRSLFSGSMASPAQ